MQNEIIPSDKTHPRPNYATKEICFIGLFHPPRTAGEGSSTFQFHFRRKEERENKAGKSVFKFNVAKHFPGYMNVLNLYIPEGQKIPQKGKFKEKMPIHIKVQTAKHRR